jgi:ferritin-like protein
MSSYEDIRRKIMLRLDQDGIETKATTQLIDDLISETCMEIAADNYYYELVKSVEGETDEDGKFRLSIPSIPYQAFIYGSSGQDHSWQRITPVTYDYFIRWKDGTYRGVFNSGGVGGGLYGGLLRRYTVLPTGDDDTVIELLEINNSVPIKLYYYPIRPTPADFPGYFEPLIIDKVLYLYSMTRRESSSEQHFGRLEKRIKKLQKDIKKIATQIEIVGAPSGVYNNKTTDWLNANDLGVWKGI